MARRKKRGPGEGSIYRRKDGRWCAQVRLEGKRETLYGKTFEEVRERLEALKASVKQGWRPEQGRATFGAWLRRWLKVYKEPVLRRSTYESYEEAIRLRLEPLLGDVPVHKLRPEHLQELYNELLEQGLSPRTVQICHCVARQALKQAVREGLVPRNVAELVSPPASRRKAARALTVEEQAGLLEAAREERIFPAVLLMLAGGLRVGEVLGLTWRDVDFRAGGVYVRRSLRRTRRGLEFTEPKSAASRRFVPLPKSVLEELRAWKRRQAEERLVLGAEWRGEDLVFTSTSGGPLEPRSLHRVFRRVLRRAGLEGVRPHDLRHTFATRLLEAGEHPKVVQELLGHSQISVTLDTYSHVMPELKRRAVEKLEGLLALKTKKPH